MKTLLALILACSLFAGTYDYKYDVVENMDETDVELKALDEFMYGDFKEIIRFDMLVFHGYKLDSKNREHYDYIVETIKDYEQKDEEIRVTIIGHTSEPTDDANEQVTDSDTYANAIQNIFRASLDTNTSAYLSKNYAGDVQQRLIDSNISKSVTIVEYRRGDDIVFSDATEKGRNLSNRVMVTLYVLPSKILEVDIDSDKDGVFDSIDECPDTPLGVEVDSRGCPLDCDRDGVADYKDECPETPLGVSVDEKGCALDSDRDGVLNYKDECPGTPQGFKVDTVGCPTSKELRLNFTSNSYKIPEESYPKVVEFAKFLKENPAYNVEMIGHTDSIGKDEANLILSQNRAASVKDALVSEGIDASRLVTKGRGEIEPVQTNETKEGRRANRRTEVKLSYNE